MIRKKKKLNEYAPFRKLAQPVNTSTNPSQLMFFSFEYINFNTNNHLL